MTAPTISDVYETTNTFTITDANGLPAGYTIRYTIDGTTPTATTGTVYSGPIVVEGNWTVKAVVVRYGLILTEVAEKAVSPVVVSPVISFDYLTNKASISCVTPSATIFYNTGDGSQADPTTNTGTQYFNPIDVTGPTTVKAISSLGSEVSSVATLAIAQVETPTIQNNGNNAISITSGTLDATIYYTTNGDPPTTSSTLYIGPLTENVSGVTIKAIAMKEGMITSAVGSGAVTLRCDAPVITRNGNTGFIATCPFPNSDVTIYYTTGDGTQANPTTSSSSIPSGGSVTVSLPITVKAMAVAPNYSNSIVTTVNLTPGMGGNGTAVDPYTIEYQNDVVDFIDKANTESEASKYYKVISPTPLDFSGAGSITRAFSGHFDGNFCTLTGFGHALFNVVDGGTVRNVILKDVSISGTGNVGAICNEAKGYSRIYNCGILPATADFPNDEHSTVTATGADGCAGGLVGKLDDDSRVVNCFSYADVSSTGYAAGIVGNNTFASDASVTDGKYTKLRTMVVNCMFYGDITGGSQIWPVYGGLKINNGGGFGNTVSDGYYAINNYNFYSDSCNFSIPLETSHNYNCSWPAKYDYLTNHEFLRYLLNSNRELCGWWVGASSAPSTMSTTEVQNVPKDASLMAKWVLDPSIAPFPILKTPGYYSSPVNIDADADWRLTANEWEGKNLGTLSVTVNPGERAASGVNSTTKAITITDMDTLRNDFCYRKIQLPYYNSVFGNPAGVTWDAKYGGNYKDYVVTGWEITSVTGGTQGEYVENWESGYNFADRDCTDKDSHRIFAQGGYYYVPNGVTAITITAHWGKAFYLGNGGNCYDRVDFDHLLPVNSSTLSRKNHPGTAFEPAGIRPSYLPNGETIQTDSITAVVSANITTEASVYDNALVLVSNHQFCQGPYDIKSSTNSNVGFTIMSADFDFDNEPDYCLEWQLGQGTNRQSFCPIRFDFLPVVEIGLCLKKDGSQQYYSLGCYRPLGHYEVTETALIRFGQFEFSNKSRTKYAPIIMNGGIYEQYVKGTNGNAFNAANDMIDYIILGGRVYMPSFTPGAHVNSNATYPTRHCAVNVLGGKFDAFYLAGNYNDAVTPNADNPHCYIDGGWFDHVASAGKEGIGKPNVADPKGNVTFKINHARIKEFYGGGIMSGHEVKGNIDVTVDNSRVYKYCGGPKFGDMVLGKTVHTEANGTFFGVYYGAGNGGTTYVQYHRTDGTNNNSNGFNWTSTGHVNNTYYQPRKYQDDRHDYQANYDMELINVSTGTYNLGAVNRTYFYSAQYAATNTGPVTNKLTGCVVEKNFYGAGLLGGVIGDVTSTLDNTQVKGSVYGAGFSAAIPTVTIYNRDKVPPTIDLYTGKVTPQSGGTSTTYTWIHDVPEDVTQPTTTNPVVVIDGKNYFYTEDPLENLGMVNGNVTLTIKGNSKVGTDGDSTTGNVFGGGDQSAVNGSTTVNLQQGTTVLGNVYGGGNEGLVGGNSQVIIENP